MNITIHKIKHITRKHLVLLLVLGVAGYAGYYVAFGKDQPMSTSYVRSTSYATVRPVLSASLSSSTVFVGTVQSNDAGSVFARRAGIVGDILVDIGDKVEAGQVLATLLPSGVEGESSAKIAQAQASLREAQLRLERAQARAAAMSDQSQERIVQEEVRARVVEQTSAAQLTELEELVQTTIAREDAAVRAAKERVEVAQAMLDRAETAYQEAIAQAPFLDQLKQDTYLQKQIGLVSATRSVLDGARQIFGGGVTLSGYVSAHALPEEIGIRGVQTRNQSVALFQEVLGMVDEADTHDEFLVLAQRAAELTRTLRLLVEESEQGGTISEMDLVQLAQVAAQIDGQLITATDAYFAAYTNTVLQDRKTNESVLLAEDARNQAQAQLATAQEEYAIAEANRNKLVLQAQRQYETRMIARDGELDNSASSVAVAEKQYELTNATSAQEVTSARTALAIAQAKLQEVYAKEGHTTIISPFDGTIATRHIQIGAMVTMSNPVYDLVHIPSTLAEIAAQEIVFDLPDEQEQAIEAGDEVQIVVDSMNQKAYTGYISRISPQVDEMTHSVEVRAALRDETVRLPDHVRVRVYLGDVAPAVYRLPSYTVKRDEAGAYVWLAQEDGKDPLKMSITVVAEDGEFSEVIGISDQDLVIRRYQEPSYE
jgi:multidrug efflux pump subunit AcrA (membrane-fusion protein)